MWVWVWVWVWVCRCFCCADLQNYQKCIHFHVSCLHLLVIDVGKSMCVDVDVHEGMGVGMDVGVGMGVGMHVGEGLSMGVTSWKSSAVVDAMAATHLPAAMRRCRSPAGHSATRPATWPATVWATVSEILGPFLTNRRDIPRMRAAMMFGVRCGGGEGVRECKRGAAVLRDAH